MPADYLPIAIMMFVAAFIAAAALTISYLFGPRRSSVARSDPYESGIRPLMSARQRFPIKFYLVAMLFIVFDVETVFFYPWAVAYRQLGLFALIEMLVFVAILLVGYIYIVRKGVLDWR
jgi:NADH-quinone oxidoreductase subunit A